MIQNILCFGDSNTWGYNPGTGGRYSFDQRWPGVMRTDLGEGYWIIEEGYSGRTTVYDDPVSEGRSGKSYLLPCLLTHSPLDLVIFSLGTNDLKTKFASGAYDISSGLASLVRITLKAEAGHNGRPPEIIVISPAHVIEMAANNTWEGQFTGAEEKSRQLARHYQHLADDYGCHFLDAAKHITSSQIDGIHLDVSQHKILGEVLASQVRGILAGN